LLFFSRFFFANLYTLTSDTIVTFPREAMELIKLLSKGGV
jgi:hypothetical protein